MLVLVISEYYVVESYGCEVTNPLRRKIQKGASKRNTHERSVRVQKEFLENTFTCKFEKFQRFGNFYYLISPRKKKTQEYSSK
jgi:hypothetical protein